MRRRSLTEAEQRELGQDAVAIAENGDHPVTSLADLGEVVDQARASQTGGRR
ncbi:hypothetical protein [Nonomuraea salmonea]|uniref:Antitoxin n=1 Tax=Nonomuraea salmonea TaxID=46181 RepID=A0ABV5P2M9_9ACTN